MEHFTNLVEMVAGKKNHYCVKVTFSNTPIDLVAILKKNLNRTTFVYILKNFRMCTIAVEALTPLDRTSRIKMYKDIARSRLFCRISRGSMLSQIRG